MSAIGARDDGPGTAGRLTVVRFGGWACAIGAGGVVAGFLVPERVTFLAGAGLVIGAGVLAAVVGAARRSARRCALGVAVALAGAAVAAAPTGLVAAREPATVWTRFAPENDATYLRVGARVYERDEHAVRVLDPARGTVRTRVRALGGDVAVAPDGGFVQLTPIATHRGEARYVRPDGSRGWTVTTRSPAQFVAALDHGAAVLLDRAHGGRAWRARGVGADGKVRWTSRADGFSWQDKVRKVSWDDDWAKPGVRPVPRVAALRVGGAWRVRAPSGAVTDRFRTDLAGVADDLVITRDRTGVLTARRAGARVWRTGAVARTGFDHTSTLLTRNTLYVAGFGPAGTTDAIDLRTGHHRRIGEVIATSFVFTGNAERGIAGDTIVVRHHGGGVTGEDPATGRRLWRFATPDPHPMISEHNGAVVVTAAHPARWWTHVRALAGRTPATREVTVLDARTGRVTGRAGVAGVGRGYGAPHDLAAAYGIAPGRAVLQTNDGRTLVVGSAP